MHNHTTNRALLKELISPRFYVHVCTQTDVPGRENSVVSAIMKPTMNIFGNTYIMCWATASLHSSSIHRKEHEKAMHTHRSSVKESYCAHLILQITQSMAGLIVITKYLWLAADKNGKRNNSSFTYINPLYILKGVLQDLKRIASTELIREIYRRKWKPLVTSKLFYLNAIFSFRTESPFQKSNSLGASKSF